jgi:CRISPR/Cas system-associated exonuclease Cas4 (RecB family)
MSRHQVASCLIGQGWEPGEGVAIARKIICGRMALAFYQDRTLSFCYPSLGKNIALVKISPQNEREVIQAIREVERIIQEGGR